MKFILDFDRTLFDTDSLREQFARDKVPTGVISPEVWQTYVAADYLFPDALEFLRKQNATDVHILTAMSTQYGDKIFEYHKAKVEQKPIMDLVSSVHYVTKAKGHQANAIAAKYSQTETIYFVDDLLENCLDVVTHVPSCKCVLMDRSGVHDPRLSTPKGVSVVRNFTELSAIISS